MHSKLTVLFIALTLLTSAQAHDDAVAHYLANEGLMVAHGDTKILFDPLFRESYGQYRLVPDAMRAALFEGSAPWDGIDAVFISHYHDDHFAPDEMLILMRQQPQLLLFAPRQAVAAMRKFDDDESLFERVTAVNLAYRDAPVSYTRPGLLIEAVRIPHSGWPDRRTDVENIAWRVTLDDGPTVLHLGDADTRDAHFANDPEYWRQRYPDMAFPPYWFFLSNSGKDVLTTRIRAGHAVGVHVPVSVPQQENKRDPALQGVDLFTTPGETRMIDHAH